MARYNEILVGRFARSIQKLFGVKGEVPVGSLAGEISVVWPFFVGAENRYLESWDTYAISVFPAAGGAGNRAAVRLRNPAGSNVIAVIESLLVTETLADLPEITIGAGADLTTVLSTTNVRIDSRSRPQPTLVPSQTGNFGALPTVVNFILSLGATTSFQVINDVIQELTLLPGDALTIISGTLNQTIGASVQWRERFLEESERS